LPSKQPLQVISPNQSSDKDLSYYLGLPNNQSRQIKTSRNAPHCHEMSNISNENDSLEKVQFTFKDMCTPKAQPKSANRFINSASEVSLKVSNLINQQERRKTKGIENFKVPRDNINENKKEKFPSPSVSNSQNGLKTPQSKKKLEDKGRTSTEHLVNLRAESFLSPHQKSLLESCIKERSQQSQKVLTSQIHSERSQKGALPEFTSRNNKDSEIYSGKRSVSPFKASLLKHDLPKDTPENEKKRPPTIYSPWPTRQAIQDEEGRNQRNLSRSNSLKSTPLAREDQKHSTRFFRSGRNENGDLKQQANQSSDETHRIVKENHQREIKASKELQKDNEEVNLMELVRNLQKELQVKELEAMELREEKLRGELENKKLGVEIEEIEENIWQNEEKVKELQEKAIEQEKEIKMLKVRRIVLFFINK